MGAFQSTQWTGWVPGPGNVKGDLDNSQFTVTNVRVSGSIVFGLEPPKCTGPAPTPTPTPTPSPSGGCCAWVAAVTTTMLGAMAAQTIAVNVMESGLPRHSKSFE